MGRQAARYAARVYRWWRPPTRAGLSRRVRHVVLQESLPRLRRWSSPSVHVFGDGGLRYVMAEQCEFSFVSRRSPSDVFNTHTTHQCADLHNDLWSSHLRSRLPAPVASEALAVPTEDRLGLDDDDGGAPLDPDSREPCPEDSMSSPEPWSLDGSLSTASCRRRGLSTPPAAAASGGGCGNHALGARCAPIG